jgi:hypothetical protein
MYFDNGGKIAGTHYCVIVGNRPQFLFKAATRSPLPPASLELRHRSQEESHMHSMKIIFKDANTIATSCGAIMDGKEVPAKES